MQQQTEPGHAPGCYACYSLSKAVRCHVLQVHSSMPAVSSNNSNGGDLATPGGVPSSVSDLAASSNLTALAALLEDPEFQASNSQPHHHTCAMPLAWLSPSPHGNPICTSMHQSVAGPAATVTAQLQESNLKHSINGFMYCNMPGLEASLGQRVRWPCVPDDPPAPLLHAMSLCWSILLHCLQGQCATSN